MTKSKENKRVIFSLALLGAVLFLPAFYYYQSLFLAHTKNEITIDIPRGRSTEEIFADLQSHEIIQSALMARLYLRLSGRSPLIQAGHYSFGKECSTADVIKILEAGPEVFDKLTVIEGWNIFDIAQAISQIKSLNTSYVQALKLLKSPALIRSEDPQAPSLEGYLFPDTYFILADTTSSELISLMVDRFKKVWAKDLCNLAQRRGQSMHEAVVIASIIETEAKIAKERPIVSSVIYNRLKKGMTLSMDSTIVYASKLAGKWKNDGKVYKSDIDRNSPYNTRKVIGLPPAPVGCPGLSSLKAALEPANTNYLYYVRNPNMNGGEHNFYADEIGFEAGVNALREWERQRDRHK